MLVTFDGIQKKFGKKIVLDGLSFQVNKGDFVGLVGNNGCGKTTTIHILCNLIRYQAGDYLFDNQKVTSSYVSFKKRLGVVLSNPYYIEEFSIEEYWRFVCKFQQVPESEVQHRIQDLLKLLDLISDAGQSIQKLSSGNQMKVSLGAALIHNPEMLILDEPFINLDIATTESVLQLLDSFKGKKTLLITSHNLDRVVELCDRFLIMESGKIALELDRTDYINAEELKIAVKDKLSQRKSIQDISWLG